MRIRSFRAGFYFVITGQYSVNMGREPTISDERKLRILLLEDEPALARLFGELIRDWYPVADLVAVQNGDMAWRELSQWRVDLFITDCIHPGLNGIEILLRLADQKAKFPILWTSSLGLDQGPQYRKMLDGPSLNVTCLPKPFLPQELQVEISRLLGPCGATTVLEINPIPATSGSTASYPYKTGMANHLRRRAFLLHICFASWLWRSEKSRGCRGGF